jgi:hypothetical protein
MDDDDVKKNRHTDRHDRYDVNDTHTLYDSYDSYDLYDLYDYDTNHTNTIYPSYQSYSVRISIEDSAIDTVIDLRDYLREEGIILKKEMYSYDLLDWIKSFY